MSASVIILDTALNNNNVSALCDKIYNNNQTHVYSKSAEDANIYSNFRISQ